MKRLAMLCLLALFGCMEGPAGPQGEPGKDGESGLPGRIYVQDGMLLSSLAMDYPDYGEYWKMWLVDVPDSIGQKMSSGALIQVYAQVDKLGWAPAVFSLSPINGRILVFHNRCLDGCPPTSAEWEYRIVVAY
jgi:hypothetical protein